MHAYFTLIWDPLSAAAKERSGSVRLALARAQPGSAPSFSAEGIEVHDLAGHPNDASVVLLRSHAPDISGVVYGTLFPRSGSHNTTPSVRELDPAAARRACETRGGSLISEFWGSYVAFIRHGATICVVSDPTGAVPCFYTQAAGVTLVFSHLERCRFLDLSQFTINEAFVRRLLAYDKIQTGETGLNGVRELCGGQRLTIDGQAAHTDRLWNPAVIARDMRCPPQEAAAEELSATARQVVSSWAGCFSNVTVSLSGGLDSSIVLACLAGETCGHDLDALHIIMESGDQPEVHYARMMASLAGCPLMEATLSPSYPIKEVTAHPPSVRPWRQFLAFDYDRLAGLETGSVGPVLFTGQGGDHLFLETSSPLGFADYLRHKGPDTGTLAALRDAARLSGLPYADVLLRSLPAALGWPHRSSAARAMQARQTLINRRAGAGLDFVASLPDWARRIRTLPPGKCDQLGLLPHMSHARDPLELPGGRTRIHPLISQPLIELCLRYPVWLLAAGGESRGLAKMAFRGALPDSIRLRTSKGDASRFFARQLGHNRERLIAGLSEGRLAARDLIDPAALARFMDRAGPETDPNGRMLFQYYAVEAWLRCWDNPDGLRPDP